MPVLHAVGRRAIGSLSLAGLVAVGACSRPAPAAPAPTFNKDIAPILFAHCATCHRPGEVGPFPLLTYADAVRHAHTIVDVTAVRYMPPWLPDHGDFPLVGERRLSDPEIAAIARWVQGGTPEGAPADLPTTPTWPSGWQLGQPDLVLTLPKPYVLPPGTTDVYRNLVFHTALSTDVYVRAVEFKTNGAPVHHAVIRLDPTDAARRQDGRDGQPGFEGMSWQEGADPDGQFLGWAPGRGPILSPADMPWRLDRRADLVVQLHMLPTGAPVSIQPTIGLFLTDTRPTRTPLTVRMGSKIIDIPAGQADYLVADTYVLPVMVSLLSIYPHAHYLGKDMRLTATFPDGSQKTLLHIAHWNFHWQQDYRYVTPVALPPGTTLRMQYVYDNSTANPANPRNPPVRVRFGGQSSDEMAELGLQVLTASLADAAAIAHDFDLRDSQANVALAEWRVNEAPNVAASQAELGASLVDVGRFDEALPHLEAALRLDDTLAGAHTNLGTILIARGQLAEALGHLERAVALAPQDESTWYNLGNALRQDQRLDAAERAYTKAIQINPAFAEGHENLGSLLFARGRLAEAVPHFEQAVLLKPHSAILENNLAGALAASGRLADAMVHVRKALALKPDYVPALDNLKRLEQQGIR